jgi:Zn-dependent membrane protease YugP
VEFNASRRALSVIESNGLLSFEEKNGASKVLKMAAMTYVAALATSVAQLLRLILIFGGGGRRRR